jgi:hypothetical protein
VSSERRLRVAHLFDGLLARLPGSKTQIPFSVFPGDERLTVVFFNGGFIVADVFQILNTLPERSKL